MLQDVFRTISDPTRWQINICRSNYRAPETNHMNIKTDQNRIQIETLLSVTREKAWELLTHQAHIEKWWGDHVSLEARSGGRFHEVWLDGERRVITSGKITAFNPPSELKMTWADDDWSDDTAVAFSLHEDSGGTMLVLEHSGWDIHPAGKRKNLIEAHMKGWSRYLHRFAAYTTET